MVGEVEDDGTDYTDILEAWLDGSNQLPALVKAATQRILQGCVPEMRGNPMRRFWRASTKARNGRPR